MRSSPQARALARRNSERGGLGRLARRSRSSRPRRTTPRRSIRTDRQARRVVATGSPSRVSAASAKPLAARASAGPTRSAFPFADEPIVASSGRSSVQTSWISVVLAYVRLPGRARAIGPLAIVQRVAETRAVDQARAGPGLRSGRPQAIRYPVGVESTRGTATRWRAANPEYGSIWVANGLRPTGAK